MEKVKIVFATNNKDKLQELNDILKTKLSGDDFEVFSLKDLKIEIDVEENGSTYEENAMLKAEAVHELLNDFIVVADDSGLEVDAMPEELGIHSARFMGHDTDYSIKNNAILEKLEGKGEDERTARFICAIAAVFPNSVKKTVRGVWEGKVAKIIKGENGFGYDPIFYLPEYSCTSAELSKEIKNSISHRARALQQFVCLEELKYYTAHLG